MLVTVWGYAECYAVLHRKCNGGQLDASALAEAVTSLQEEFLASGEIHLLSIEDERVLAGLNYVTRDSLNSNAAAILATYVRYRQHLPPGSPACALIADDERLLRVARAEDFVVLNPERIAHTDVVALLSSF